jgi:hypothetical protein
MPLHLQIYNNVFNGLLAPVLLAPTAADQSQSELVVSNSLNSINAPKFDFRDSYHFILTLTWPRFAALVLAVYVLINIVFASLYLLGGRCIAELPPGSFYEAFSSA